MYETTPTIYFKIAELLLEKIGMRDFFSGSVSLADGDVECRLVCTLVVDREKGDPRQVVALLPVWWEFETVVDGDEVLNDFSWREMLDAVEL